MTSLIVSSCNATLATALGALAGALSNYFLQFHWTFRCEKSHRITGPLYLMVSLVSILANTGLFFLIYQMGAMSLLLAQVVTTALVACLNFILYQRVVFHERNTSSLVS